MNLPLNNWGYADPADIEDEYLYPWEADEDLYADIMSGAIAPPDSFGESGVDSDTHEGKPWSGRGLTSGAVMRISDATTPEQRRVAADEPASNQSGLSPQFHLSPTDDGESAAHKTPQGPEQAGVSALVDNSPQLPAWYGVYKVGRKAV